jgi:glutamine synthetase
VTSGAGQQISDLIDKNNQQIVEIEFSDLPGLWQHFSMPPSELVEIDASLRRKQRGQ